MRSCQRHPDCRTGVSTSTSEGVPRPARSPPASGWRRTFEAAFAAATIERRSQAPPLRHIVGAAAVRCRMLALITRLKDQEEGCGDRRRRQGWAL